MNERIKELLIVAGEYEMDINDPEFVVPDTLKKFAELIVRECARISNEVDYTMTNQGAASAQAFMEHFGVEE
jgi:hypothetical protein